MANPWLETYDYYNDADLAEEARYLKQASQFNYAKMEVLRAEINFKEVELGQAQEARDEYTLRQYAVQELINKKKEEGSE